MVKTTMDEFRESLLRTGGYDTASDHRASRRAKPSAWTTLSYSLRVGSVFPRCAIYEPLGRLTTDKWARFCFSTVTGAEALGMNVHVEGWKNRESHKGPVVYLCNHMSTIETLLLPSIVLAYGPFNVVAKQSLVKIPFLEEAAAHLGVVPIGRQSPREDLVNMLRISEVKIKEGNSFLIFPQGTRHTVFSPRKVSSIGAKIAEKAGCPIVPIVVDTRCQMTREKGLLKGAFKDFGPVDPSYDLRCCCGPVIAPDKSKAMHEKTVAWMLEQHRKWGLPVEE